MQFLSQKWCEGKINPCSSTNSYPDHVILQLPPRTLNTSRDLTASSQISYNLIGYCKLQEGKGKMQHEHLPYQDPEVSRTTCSGHKTVTKAFASPYPTGNTAYHQGRRGAGGGEVFAQSCTNLHRKVHKQLIYLCAQQGQHQRTDSVKQTGATVEMESKSNASQ